MIGVRAEFIRQRRVVLVIPCDAGHIAALGAGGGAYKAHIHQRHRSVRGCGQNLVYLPLGICRRPGGKGQRRHQAQRQRRRYQLFHPHFPCPSFLSVSDLADVQYWFTYFYYIIPCRRGQGNLSVIFLKFTFKFPYSCYNQLFVNICRLA